MEVFEAIAQPTRREILRLLADGELSAGSIASHFSITQPAVSQHLKTLRQSGLIGERRDGTRRLYSIRPESLVALQDFLGELMPGRLARLKQAAEEEELRERERTGERN